MVGFWGASWWSPICLQQMLFLGTEASWQPPQIARRASTMSDDQTAGWGGFFSKRLGWVTVDLSLRTPKLLPRIGRGNVSFFLGHLWINLGCLSTDVIWFLEQLRCYFKNRFSAHLKVSLILLVPLLPSKNWKVLPDSTPGRTHGSDRRCCIAQKPFEFSGIFLI